MDFYPSYDPLYLQPLYQQRIVFGSEGCPFTCQHYTGNVDYSKGICPNAEALGTQVFSTEVVRPPMTFADMDEIVRAFQKVIDNVEQLGKIN